MTNQTILITGANGQIGSVLAQHLRQQVGNNRVIVTDLKPPREPTSEPFELLDVLQPKRFRELLLQYQVTEVYHLAALLSASGEQNPARAWEVNMTSLLHVLGLARELKFKLFFPSSIAVFGPDIPKANAPQDARLQPSTVYGISKAAGELWCQYYHDKHGVDVRSVRYPGIIGHQSMPGGGTTDYAVDIFHHAVREEPYTCFLSEHTRLPMMYMEDAIRATIAIMEAPAEQIKLRTSYNIAGTSFTPAEVTEAIRQHHPDFKVIYEPDFRQAIADSWPNSTDDQLAREHWGWSPVYDLPGMVSDMLHHLNLQYSLTHEIN